MQNLRLFNYRKGNHHALGLRSGERLFDVAALAQIAKQKVPTSVEDLLVADDLGALQGLADKAGNLSSAAAQLDERDLEFAPCVTRPGKIIGIGLNYRQHAAEVNMDLPTEPVMFAKFPSSLLGHRGTIRLPTNVDHMFDYEAELVVVIGRPAHQVSPEQAWAHIFGYCVGNDFSARGLQFRTTQFTLGKTSDGFAPIGPDLVPAASVPDPHALKIECRVNGEVRQSSNTGDMVFNCGELVSYLSQVMTLMPGDLIFTGTPEGVTAGRPEAERVWLKAGDRIETTIGALGTLEFDLA